MWFAAALFLLTLSCFTPARAQVSVAAGSTLYTSNTFGTASTTCVTCHTSPALGSVNHRLASNNPSRIALALVTSGQMLGTFPSPPTTDQQFSLALHIGQIKNPIASSATRATHAGFGRTINLYPLLDATGAGGAPSTSGVSRTLPSNGTVSAVSHINTSAAAFAYNVTYTPSGGHVGSDSFNYTATNAGFPSADATNTGTITMITVGITSAASASLLAGSSGSYAITTNCGTDCALSSATPYSVSGTLPSGMSFSTASGIVSGTPASTAFGSYPVIVGASTTINGVTRVVTKAVTLTVVGVSSAGSAAATQGSAFNYSITTNGTPSGVNPYSASGLPAGLAVNTATGAITGTPVNGGASNVTIGVNTTLGAVSRTLTITTAFAGVPGVSATPASPSGNVNVAYPAVQIIGTNPPVTSYGASGLPPGLSVNSSSGAISGTPTQSGLFAATLSATNGVGTGTALVNFLVVPTTPPAISNAATVSTLQGVPYADTISANNPPIGSYGASGMPPGLAVHPTTGAISGTPTQSGIFNAVLSATNAAGTGTRAVTYTILPTSLPVISAPGALSGTAGVAMAPASIVANNPPVTAYGGSGLPAGVTVNPATGQISGTPAAPGNYVATLTATNNAGTGQVSVAFVVGALPPTAGNANLAVPVNGAATLDLATVTTGFGITGVNILSPPARGTLAVSGTVVTYRPNADYFGADSFTYEAFGTGGTSPPGTVSVTVTGRPDPLANPAVTGLAASQLETSRRFAKTQMTNFQRRLDFLHRPASRGRTGAALAPSPLAPPAAAQDRGETAPAVAAGAADSRHGDRALALAWSGRNDASQRGLAGALPETTDQSLARVAAAAGGQAPGSAENAVLQFVQVASRSIDPATASPAMVAGVIDLAAHRRLDLAAVAGNLAAPDAGRVGVWAGGSVDFGKRAGAAGAADSSFSTTGVSAGADRWVSDDLIVGAGIGYARNETDIGSDGSESVGTGTSFAVYASYQPGDAFFDALLGFVSLGYDNARYVAAENAFAKSERSGRQLFATVSAGYVFQSGGIALTPYGRVEYASDRIDGAAETGVGSNALNYGEQQGNAVAGAVGLRLESVHATRFGWATPRLRLELRRESERSDESAISYVDLPGTSYRLGADRSSRHARLFGIGTEFETRAGSRFGIEYQLQDSETVRRGETLLLTFSTVFGQAPVRRSADDVVSKPLGFRVEAGYIYDDNINRARNPADRLADPTASLAISRGRTFPLTTNSRLWLNGSLAADRSHHFEGLDRVSASGIAELQYRTSGSFDAPTFALSLRASGEDYRSELRDGFRGSATLSMQQAFTDRIGLFAAVAASRRDARSAVFDVADRSARLNLDYALGDAGTVYLGGEVRRGSIVSSGRSSLDDITIAEVVAPDDAYPGRSFFAYRLDATTTIATLGYNLRFGNRDSIDLSVRRIESTPRERPAWSLAEESYVAHQVSVFYLTRF